MRWKSSKYTVKFNNDKHKKGFDNIKIPIFTLVVIVIIAYFVYNVCVDIYNRQHLYLQDLVIIDRTAIKSYYDDDEETYYTTVTYQTEDGVNPTENLKASKEHDCLM